MFSKACEYAIRAVVVIATYSMEGERHSVKVIAERTGTPEAFMAKTLQKLSRAGIIVASKGPGGGSVMPPRLSRNVKLVDIVKAIDGDGIFTGCALGLPACSDAHPCPLHDQFAKVRSDLRRMLERTTVHDLALSLKEGRSELLH
jgi:Rrf2 family protein